MRVYNDQYREEKSEVTVAPIYLLDTATHMQHIFPATDYPEISAHLENIIALTPTQHNNKAHPEGNTQKIDRTYQQICLLAKSGIIKEDIEQHSDPMYSFQKFLYVLCVGFENGSIMEIEDGDFDGVITAINLEYI